MGNNYDPWDKSSAAPLPPTVAALVRLYEHAFDTRVGVPTLVGIRSQGPFSGLAQGTLDGRRVANDAQWDDYLGFVVWDGVMWQEHLFCGTTDPGNLAKMGQRGTAVMLPGLYKEAYTLGKHRGYDAIVNWGKVAPMYMRVTHDPETKEISTDSVVRDEYIGLNIHRARRSGEPPPKEVGPFSRGCQVIRYYEDWEWFLDRVTRLTEMSAQVHDLEYLDYALLTLEGDIKRMASPQQEQHLPPGPYVEPKLTE